MADSTRLTKAGLPRKPWSPLRDERGIVVPLSPEDIRYIRDSWHDASVAEIANHIGRAPVTVRLFARKLGLPRQRLLSADLAYENFFAKIDTNVKAYIAGLIAADGWVGKHRSGSGMLTLTLQERDRGLVEFVRDQIAPGFPLRVRAPATNSPINGHAVNGGPQVGFQITSSRIADDLFKLGIVERKTKILTWPAKLPKKRARAFILGYFDGDGSLSWNPSRAGFWGWKLASFRADFLESICDVIEQGCGIRPNGPYIPKGKVPRIEAVSRKAMLIDEWLNQDGLGWPRKHLSVEEIQRIRTRGQQLRPDLYGLPVRFSKTSPFYEPR